MMTVAPIPPWGPAMPLKRVDQLEDMPEPFEILEMEDGQTKTLRVVKYREGRMWLEPRDGRPRKQVQVLRVWVPPTDKPTIPPYWDITAKHLINGLLGYLETRGAGTHEFTITKQGKPPVARFRLEARPA